MGRQSSFAARLENRWSRDHQGEALPDGESRGRKAGAWRGQDFLQLDPPACTRRPYATPGPKTGHHSALWTRGREKGVPAPGTAGCRRQRGTIPQTPPGCSRQQRHRARAAPPPARPPARPDPTRRDGYPTRPRPHQPRTGSRVRPRAAALLTPLASPRPLAHLHASAPRAGEGGSVGRNRHPTHRRCKRRPGPWHRLRPQAPPPPPVCFGARGAGRGGGTRLAPPRDPETWR